MSGIKSTEMQVSAIFFVVSVKKKNKKRQRL